VKPVFFATAAEFRRWLERHHASETELLVGFYKKGSGRPSITWPESVDEALCFGWIDGIRRSAGEHAYTIRFTPRKPSSIWSAVNVRNVERLVAEGRMQPAGLAAYATRSPERTALYSFDRQNPPHLDADMEARFRKQRKAWTFWESQPPGYRKTATHWVVSAKRAETRERRLKQLIDDCAAGQRIAALRRPGD
jgi:uncharacterized protein YdeI (YjbR/CyaY-like superfamily)